MQSMMKNNARYSYAVLALGILTFLTTLAGIVRHYSPVPYWDQWDGKIDFYMRSLSNPLSAFFGQHNEHRLFLSRLIFFADVRYFGGRSVFELAANVVLAALIVLLVYRIVTQHLQASAMARAATAGTALIFTFSWMQSENFTWGFQSQWFAVYLSALCAFHALEVSSELRSAGNPAKSRAWLGAAIGSAILAALSMASGLLVSPVLVVQAIYLRFSRTRIVVLSACTIAIWCAYFANWHASDGGGSLTASLRANPAGLPAFVLLYLGSPVHYLRLGETLTCAWGALVLGGLAYSMHIAMRRGRRPLAVSMLAMAIFLIGNAAVTAVGRLPFGLATAVASRYTTAALLAMCSVLLFLWLNEANQKRRKWGLGFFIFAIIVITSYQRIAFHSAQEELYRRSLAGLALRAHVYDLGYTRAIYPEPGRLREIASRAEAMGLSIFAPGQQDYDIAPQSVHSSGQCLGKIEEVMPTMTPGVLAARGWVFDPATQEYARSIVLTDTDGIVLGTGLTGDKRPELSDVTHSKDKFGGWVGFFKKTEGQEIRAFGKVGPGRYCSLATGTRLPDVATMQALPSP